MSNYAIILAGGIGSRFWPLSTETEPKQFLNVCSDKSMLEETIERIGLLIPKENICLAVNIKHKDRISLLAQRLGIPIRNILFEPESKNTFPPIAVLSYRINCVDKDSVISVLPCDHVIKNSKRFRGLLSEAIQASKQGNIVTFGIRPKRPETGYGYLRIKMPDARGQRPENKKRKIQIYNIERFIEKPDLTRAKRFVKDKRYYWNSGIFVFKSSVMLEEIKKIMPEVFRLISSGSHLASLWSNLPAVSIDYAIMENTANLILLPAEYGWMDLGSWQAIAEISKKDKHNNIFKGNCVDLSSKNTIVWADDNRIIATIGLENIIIVQNKDALLVCAKDKTQEVKKIVHELQNLKLNNQ